MTEPIPAYRKERGMDENMSGTEIARRAAKQ